MIARAARTYADALAHSDGRKLPRPALTAVRPKRQDNPGRDAPHIGQAKQYGREASPGQDNRSNREPGQLSLARNWPASLTVAIRKDV